MSKQNLIDSIALSDFVSKAAAKRWVEAVLTGLEEELQAGNEVRLPGFGIFKLVHKPARQARHPQTGESIAVAAKTVVKFSPAAALSASVN